MPNDLLDQKKQLMPAMVRSASLADVRTGPTAQKTPMAPGSAPKNTLTGVQPAGIRVSFFFDGTGNNLDADYNADEKKSKHSNVARLFRAHENNPARGVFRHYIPGLGTLFTAINDTGGSWGGGTGGGGSDRLDWAMDRLKEHLTQTGGQGATVSVALFGFSRGAALARAFALNIAGECKRGTDGVWRFSYKGMSIPLRLYFMGLFDTVASVGVAMGANNEPARGLTAHLFGLETAMKNRAYYDNALENIAFGRPGADPASGSANGHMSWGDDLHVHEMVEDCLHLVAAHEVRNSFPLDSLLQKNHYPKNCREMVFPGAHSDVGGGYREGEGARSPGPGTLLSLLPLHEMRAQALKAGVPLLKQLDSELQRRDFAEDVGGKAGLETLKRRYTQYMSQAGWGGRPLGTEVLAHMKLYFQWRFYKIARDERLRALKQPTQDASFLKDFEPQWKKESEALKARSGELKRDYEQHTSTAIGLSRYALTPGLQNQALQEAKLADQSRQKYLYQESLVGAQMSSDGSFARNSALYDAQLLTDARALQAQVKKGKTNLRPHYRALLEAYEAQQRGQGLSHPDIIAFFDTYVHDSLAGFASDATLPSDPRVIYTGEDMKLQYAQNKSSADPRRTSSMG